MTLDKTPPHIKLAERNHVEKPLLLHLNMPGCGIIPLMQDLLTGKVRVTPLLSESQEASA
jgi:hypothetical protein